ncbi:hypothetical protein ACS0TY_017167 [Phlomoides rotata]
MVFAMLMMVDMCLWKNKLQYLSVCCPIIQSSQTVHQHFHNVLRVVLTLHDILLATPTPVDDDCTHPRWKHFKSLNDPLDGNIQSATETQVEDDGFIDSVKPLQAWSTRRDNLAQEIWKSENYFKTCYMNLLSTYMKQVLPNTNLKPAPHITSRITILKHTGVGLDSTTKMVEAIEEQWEGFMKVSKTYLFKHFITMYL